jgi:hypothetical protein
LQKFSTDIEQFAHHAYSTLPQDHIRNEAGKAFADGVEDPAIKIQPFLGGEMTMNEIIRQALELQVMILASRPQKRAPGDSVLADRPHRGKR